MQEQSINPLMDFSFIKKIFEEHIPFNKLLGFRLIEIKKDFARMLVPFKAELIGEIRESRVHGGVIMSAMDTVAGAAGMTSIDLVKDRLATIDLRTDFLAPALNEDLVVEGLVRRSGSRVIFIQMQAYHASQPEVIIAEGRATFSVKRGPKA
jgi:uncharacterized protein (TIGR00369 family)